MKNSLQQSGAQSEKGPESADLVVSGRIAGNCELQWVEHCATIAGALEKLAAPRGYGYLPITAQMAYAYLSDPGIFDFPFKKEKGEVVFSLEQVEARRNMLNALPAEQRAALVSAKLDKAGLSDHVHSFHAQQGACTISDAIDIGMNHCVYAVTLSSEHNGVSHVVVKQETLPYQSFLSHLLKELGWPSYRSEHLKAGGKEWEIYEYLPGDNLNDVVCAKAELDPVLVQILARLACLGDLLGMGDRHLENKIRHGTYIVPIDVSYMFMDDNVVWTPEYCAGGMYEISVLAAFTGSDQQLTTMGRLFFDAYREAGRELTARAAAVKEFTAECKELDGEQRVQAMIFLQRHFTGDEVERHIAAAKSSFEDLQHRRYYSSLLRELYKKDPALVEADPLLCMYYHGDLNRTSCFYLYHQWRPNLLAEVKAQAQTHLGLSNASITQEQSRIARQQELIDYL